MTYSKNNLCHARVALLETRMAAQLSALIRNYGGVPTCVASVSEQPADASADVSRFVDQLTSGETAAIVFQTGVSIRELLKAAEKQRRGDELVSGLGHVVKVCRGPKPTAELRKLGLNADVMVPEPHTTAEMTATLLNVGRVDGGIAVIHHGERNAQVVEAARAVSGSVSELVLYRWQMPENIGPLQRLVQDLGLGLYDAVAFTSQVQVRHLFAVASEIGLSDRLREALDDEIVTAAVGPTCAEALEAFGVTPAVVPQRPKMGHLAKELAEHISSRRTVTQPDQPGHLALTVI